MSEAAGVVHGDSTEPETGAELANAQLTDGQLAEVPEPPAERPPLLRYIFMGPNGLRPGWSLLIFILIFVALSGVANFTVHKLRHKPTTATQTSTQPKKAEPYAGEKPSSVMIGEGSAFALLVFTSWIMSRIERRPIGHYGFGGEKRAARFLAGFLWGFAFLAALVGALWKAGLLVFDHRLLYGSDAWKYGAIWVLGFTCVGLLEEYLLRGYIQYTLARGFKSLYEMLFDTRHGETLGFWTAAAALSFLFGFSHGSNPGESVIGLWSAGLIGLIFCFTLWKTGSLWWALGFHAAWDWAQSFVFGVADSGIMVRGHLMATHPAGKVLLSGGATGPEGSALILPTLAVIALVAAWTLPKRKWSIEGGGVIPHLRSEMWGTRAFVGRGARIDFA